MATPAFLLPHLIVGTAALVLYWTALLLRKGSARHRSVGTVCLRLLVLTGFTVAPILVMRPGPFDPGYVVQMLYLSVCLTTVSWLAISAIRLRAEPERFRGRAFRVMGPVLLALGAVVLIASVVRRDPVSGVLSWVGLVYGSAMIAFARKAGPLDPQWWLRWHLNAVCGLFNAVNGTFMYVIAREAGLVPEGPAAQTAFQIATTVAALGLRLFFGQKLHRLGAAPVG